MTRRWRSLAMGGWSTLREEERMIRRRHAVGLFPHNALQTALDHCELQFNEIDRIAIGWNDRQATSTGSSDFGLPGYLHSFAADRRVIPVDHHLAHAASVLGTSGESRAVAVICDGRGERVSASIYRYDGEFECVGVLPIESSLGIFYEAATRFAGFRPLGAGSLMALAAFAEVDDMMPEVVKRSTLIDPERASQWSSDATIGYRTFDSWMQAFEREWTPFARRCRGDDYFEYARFARIVQNTFEASLAWIVEQAVEAVPEKAIVCAGGAFLNCKANSRISQSLPAHRLFVFPAANDAGTAVGAALEVARRSDSRWPSTLSSAFLGRGYSRYECRTALENWRVVSEDLALEDAVDRLARDLFVGKIVVWFSGRSEFGPRALGNRSLLAHPGRSETPSDPQSRQRPRAMEASRADCARVGVRGHFFNDDAAAVDAVHANHLRRST